MKENNICIIPARAGSKRLPNKNSKNFFGKPIIEYSMETAIKLNTKYNLFNKIIVSTDDTNIKKNILPNIQLHEREEELCNDKSEFLDILKAFPYEYDNILLIYPCAPMINISKVFDGYCKLKNKDAVYPIYEISEKRYTCEINKDSIIPLAPITKTHKLYLIAGNWIWYKKKYIMSTNNILGGDLGYIELPAMECQDIDDADDWEIAKWKYNKLKGDK